MSFYTRTRKVPVWRIYLSSTNIATAITVCTFVAVIGECVLEKYELQKYDKYMNNQISTSLINFANSEATSNRIKLNDCISGDYFWKFDFETVVEKNSKELKKFKSITVPINVHPFNKYLIMKKIDENLVIELSD